MCKNFTSFLLFASAMLLANACFATSDNKKPDTSFNASSDSEYAIESPSANVNKQINEPISAYSDSNFWIKSQLGDKYFHHNLQSNIAKIITFSDKKNLKFDYFLSSYTAIKAPFEEVTPGVNTSFYSVVNDFADSSIATPSLTERHSGPLVSSLISTDDDLKEYIDQEMSSDDLVNPFSTDEEDSVLDAINLDDDHLRLLAKGLIGLLALLAVFAIFKKIMR